MKKALLVVAVIASIAVMTSPALATAGRPEITLGVGSLSGNTTYQIGDSPGIGEDDIHFPLSELEWPLDVVMANLAAKYEFIPRWTLSASVAMSVTGDAGKMKDSDWTDTINPSVKTIYSESDAELDALMADIKVRYSFYQTPRLSVNAGLGYMHQNFDFSASNLDQWRPTQPWIPHDKQSGTVCTYEVTYGIPYLELGADFALNPKVALQASLGYSPIVTAEDKDDHVLRYKLIEGDCEGSAVIVNLSGRYNFLPNWFGELSISALAIQTEGTQTQSRYEATSEGPAGPIGTIDQEITSEQTSAYLSVGYMF